MALSVGERERVPFVRHDLYINEWNSIAKILVKDFIDTKYFPFQFCKAFIFHDLFGEVNKDCFIKSSLNYVTPQVRRSNFESGGAKLFSI